MTKAAYIQTLANIGVTTLSAWVTLEEETPDAWKEVQAMYGNQFNDTIKLIQKYYQQGIDMSFENMIFNTQTVMFDF